MKSICVAALPDLYVIRWLSRFLKHVFPRSRSNASDWLKVFPKNSDIILKIPEAAGISIY